MKYAATGARFSHCIQCHYAITSQFLRKHAAAYSARKRENYVPHPRVIRGKDPVAHHQAQARYRERNRDTLRAQSRAEYRAKPERFKAHLATRRARARGATGQWTAAEWRTLLDHYGHRCLACGATDNLTPDHVVPLSRGGDNTIANIQPLCLPCNLRKRTQIIDYR